MMNTQTYQPEACIVPSMHGGTTGKIFTHMCKQLNIMDSPLKPGGHVCWDGVIPSEYLPWAQVDP